MFTTARKATAAVIGALAQVVAMGLVPDKYLPVAQALLALATALGVYAVPNAADGEADF